MFSTTVLLNNAQNFVKKILGSRIRKNLKKFIPFGVPFKHVKIDMDRSCYWYFKQGIIFRTEYWYPPVKVRFCPRNHHFKIVNYETIKGVVGEINTKKYLYTGIVSKKNFFAVLKCSHGSPVYFAYDPSGIMNVYFSYETQDQDGVVYGSCQSKKVGYRKLRMEH